MDSSASAELLSRFMRTYGSPNQIQFDPWEILENVYSHSHGIRDLLAFDFENCRYILSFGAQFLTNWPTSLEVQRAYGERRSKRDLKIVQVEPRFSLTASRADSWIPVRPGTEGLLALGIASVMVRERLYDEEFIDRFTSKFEDWTDQRGEKVEGFRTAILRRFRLEDISDKTGVPLKTLIETAKEFSSSERALAIADYNLFFHKDGFFQASAIHALNALGGFIDKPGGVVRQRKAPLKALPEPQVDEIAKKALSQPRLDWPVKSSRAGTLGGNPYEINCLMLSPQALPSSYPFYRNFERVLEKTPFVVSFQPYQDASLDYVDLVLPDTTFFEKWQMREVSSLSMKTVVGVGQPVVEPLQSSRPFEDVILSLAKKMGGPMASNFPWPTHQEVLRDQLSGLYEAERGSIFIPPPDEVQLKILEEQGWRFPRRDSLDAFLKDIFEKGGWQDPVYHFNLRTATYQNIQRKFEFLAPVQDQNQETEPEDAEFPFQLILYDLPFTPTDSGGNMPVFQQTLGFQFESEWKIWVEVNPTTAEKLQVRDRDPVWVESPSGKIRTVARVFPGLAPGLLAMPLGKEEVFPPEKKLSDKNSPLRLTREGGDLRDGSVSQRTVRVKIYKTGG
ncbi:MAG: hypothetical protein A2W03_10090 [Candidatus Aminicenantes bacterium RBG_16_63_16]|nr:MAG: hypothetical protein A2W03_10090 [Candidatus Aminicenantes bacterium RBG_16_63_16]